MEPERIAASRRALLTRFEPIRFGRSSSALKRLSVTHMDGDSDSLVRCTCQPARAHGLGTAPGAGPATREPLTYSLAEAAHRIGGISERWLAMKLRDGELSGHKIGRQWRMGEADVQDLIHRSRVMPRLEPIVQEVASVKRPPEDAKPEAHPVVGQQYSLFS